jgi:cullin 1
VIGYLGDLTQKGTAHLDDQLLTYYASQWEMFLNSAKILNSLFQYLNRMWIKRNIEEAVPGVADINTTCLILWNEYFFTPLKDRLLPSLLRLILRDRKGETVDRQLIKKITTSFVTFGIDANNSKAASLDVYKKHFEEQFLQATEIFYKAESEKFIGNNPITEYMKKATNWLADEEVRVKNYLHESTRPLLMAKSEKVLIAHHANAMQDQFQPLLERDKIEDLSRMFGLLSRVPDSLTKLRELYEIHVKEQGLLAVRKVAESNQSSNSGVATPNEEEGGKKKPGPSDLDPKVYVDVLLEVHSKFESVTTAAFSNDPGFVASLDKGCREFVNRNAFCKNGSSRSSELLAKHTDALLRKSSKMNEDSETEKLLNGVMTVFKFIEDKDVFQKFYTKNLAKRLVNAASASDDAEASMISKLKEACGFEYTSKLQRMFTDMSISKDLNNDFKY